MYLFTYKQRRRIHADGTFVIGVQNYTRRHPPILSGTRGNKRSVLFTAQRGRHLFTIDATTNSFFFSLTKHTDKQQLCFLIDNCSRGIKKKLVQSPCCCGFWGDQWSTTKGLGFSRRLVNKFLPLTIDFALYIKETNYIIRVNKNSWSKLSGNADHIHQLTENEIDIFSTTNDFSSSYKGTFVKQL